MAGNLPDNLVGEMMSTAPRFTLPNFGAQKKSVQKPVSHGAAVSGAPSVPRPSAPVAAPAKAVHNQPRAVKAPAQMKKGAGEVSAPRVRISYGTSAIEDEILSRKVLDLKLRGGSRQRANASRVIDDALRSRIVSGALDLSIIEDPRYETPLSRKGRNATISAETYDSFLKASLATRLAHPEIPISKLKLTAYIRLCILALG